MRTRQRKSRILTPQSLRFSPFVAACIALSACGGEANVEEATDAAEDTGTEAIDVAPEDTFVEPTDSTEMDATEDDTIESDTAMADAPAADAPKADTAVADTIVADTTVADTFVADTTVADTIVADTKVADTFVADTKVTDTTVADTTAVDTFVPDVAKDSPGPDAVSCSPTCKTVVGTWTMLGGVGLPANKIRSLAVDGAGTIYAATWVGLYRSKDGGATFTLLAAPTTKSNPVNTAMMSLGLDRKGNPIVGVIPPGPAATSNEAVLRFDVVANTWATATMSAGINTGGYFPLGFRNDVDGNLLATWPFRNDIMRSIDDGASWTNAFPIPNTTHVPPSGPSASVKAVYGMASHPQSGELFCGTEGDQWWHSTDRGVSWSMIDAGGASALAQEPGQNGFLVAFDKDGEPLIGTQGKPDGHFLVRMTSDGKFVPSDTGFPAWAMVGTANELTVLRELVLTNEGYDFLAMPVSDSMGGALPGDLWGSLDGSAWEKLSAPFATEPNALARDGASVVVGGAGVIWRFSPTITNHLPKVSTGFAAGVIATSTTSGLTITGSATDADGDALTYAWKARGPGVVTFGSATAAKTTAAFSLPGDYVLTLHASDGKRSAGAPLIVHVTS